MLIANKIEIPDKCPEDCLYAGESFYQGNMCSRCPIFNCSKEGGFSLIELQDYREDWAKEWARFFATGEGPVLLHIRKVNKSERT